MNFKEWIISENFEGQLFYHGSPDKITNFEVGRPGVRMGYFGSEHPITTQAVFFSPDPKHADFFGQNRSSFHNKHFYYIHVAKLHVKNTLDLTKPTPQIVKTLDALGLDPYERWGSKDGHYEHGKWVYTRKPSMCKLVRSEVCELFDDPEFIKKVKMAGYDSAILKESRGLGISVAVLDPSKIEFVGFLGKNGITK